LARAGALVVILAGLSMALPAHSHGAELLYWANFDGSSVSFANLDGSGGGGQLNTTGATAPNQVAGVALDPAANRIYWANAGSGKISYANLDGTGGGGDLNTTGATVGPVRGLAIDLGTGRVYWGNAGGIFYANLDGSGGGSLSTAGATVMLPWGVAPDPAANRIYWANFDLASTNKISYANLDGTGSGADLVTTGATVAQPKSVAIDKAGGRIFWTNAGSGTAATKVSYANLDGSGGGADLNVSGANSQNTSGISLDPPGNRVHWASGDIHAIHHANLDGTGAGGNLVTTGATVNGPIFTAVLRVPSGTAPPTVGGGSVPGSPLSCSQGSWAPDLGGAHFYRAPRSFSYQWSRDGTEISGATAAQLTATATPGSYRCEVTAANHAGSGVPQTSAPHEVSSEPCVVPSLRGKKLRAARRALRRANCTPGAVRRRNSARVRAGRVIRSKPGKGTTLPGGARVKLIVSRG
jgi:hypothetical protein